MIDTTQSLDETLDELVVAYEHKVRSMPSPHASLRELYAAAEKLKQNVSDVEEKETQEVVHTFRNKLNSLLSSLVANVKSGADSVSCASMNMDDFEESFRPVIRNLWFSVGEVSEKQEEPKVDSGGSEEEHRPKRENCEMYAPGEILYDLSQESSP